VVDLNLRTTIAKEFYEKIIEYIDYIDTKATSKEGYKRILIEYVLYIDNLSNLPTRHDVIVYREKLKDRLKASSIQKHIVVIRNFYRWYYSIGYGHNITEGIKGMKIESDFKREALSVKDSIRLLKRAKFNAKKDIIGLRNYAIISILITTGLRTIELERADVEDIIFVDDEYILYIMGKGHDDKDAYVKLSKQVYKIIEKYLIARSDSYKPLFINHTTHSLGTRIKTRTIRGVVKETLRQIGIDNLKYSAHSLRHTTATLALYEGANIEETQRLLRHKDPSTTQIYVHKEKKRNSNYEYKISDTLFGKK